MPEDVQPQRMTAARFRELLADGRAPRMAGAEEPEGQGADEAAGGLFDSYLQSVPEDQRETVGTYLRDASKNVEGRLQEAAEFRKQWEPFSQIDGLSQYDPQQLSELLAWHQQVTSNPDAFQQWLAQAAKDAGLTPAEEQQLSELEQDGELSREQIEQLIQQQADQRLAPLQERLDQFESDQAVGQEETAIRQVFDEIEAEHNLNLTEQQKEIVMDLGMASAVDAKGQELPMGDASWVKKGFERFQAIASEAQRSFVDGKSQQPKPPISGGGVPATKGPRTFEEARQQAMGRLRQQP